MKRPNPGLLLFCNLPVCLGLSAATGAFALHQISAPVTYAPLAIAAFKAWEGNGAIRNYERWRQAELAAGRAAPGPLRWAHILRRYHHRARYLRTSRAAAPLRWSGIAALGGLLSVILSIAFSDLDELGSVMTFLASIVLTLVAVIVMAVSASAMTTRRRRRA
jgi:hypothetical protein